MPIAVTPFVYVLNGGVGVLMCAMFVKHAACARMESPHASAVSKTDKANISLCVIITSLFLLWTVGAILGGYFGGYTMFQNEGIQAFDTVDKTDVFVDVFQKLLGFCVLALASFQNARAGKEETFLPWGKACIAAGVVQSLLMVGVQLCFKKTLGVILAYTLSTLIDGVGALFAAASFVIIHRAKGPLGAQGYFAEKISGWNKKISAAMLAAFLLDLAARGFFFTTEVYKHAPPQMFVDMAALLKCAALLLTVSRAYSARIPKSKAYSSHE